MRIIERYSTRMRIFMGTGVWSLLAPLRLILSLFYGLHSLSSQKPAPSSSTSVSHASGMSRPGPKIISVGNIEVGGGGKTPCVLALASALKAEGLDPAVVTRGYGGRATQDGGAIALPGDPSGADIHDKAYGLPDGYTVWKGGSDAGASYELGDEAVLYLRAGLPLVVDRDRSRGIRAMSEAAGPSHIILDDAFHRTELHKDLDILLLDANKPFGNGRLLPYGSLREPASAVRRAGAVLFTRAAEMTVPVEAEKFTAGIPVFFARHIPFSLSDRSGRKWGPDDLAGVNVALVCGIARPASFENTAVEFGLVPEVSFRYDDHHSYSGGDIEEMIGECAPGTTFVTTSKDWGKVSVIFPEEIKLLRLDMAMEIQGIKELLSPVL